MPKMIYEIELKSIDSCVWCKFLERVTPDKFVGFKYSCYEIKNYLGDDLQRPKQCKLKPSCKRNYGRCSECKHKSDWESCLKTDTSIHHSYINYGDDCGMWEKP